MTPRPPTAGEVERDLAAALAEVWLEPTEDGDPDDWIRVARYVLANFVPAPRVSKKRKATGRKGARR